MKKKLTKKQQAELDWAKSLIALLCKPYKMVMKRQRRYYPLACAMADLHSKAYQIILDLGEC